MMERVIDNRVIRRFSILPIRLESKVSFFKMCYVYQELVAVRALNIYFWQNIRFVSKEAYIEDKKSRAMM